ncbi:MAG: Hsp20/alpha crystallin family protein [Solirubrobacterales bacterium]|nr:Hsp20/alpha crystallin family protein [Solirubrobacterales bacterium]
MSRPPVLRRDRQVAPWDPWRELDEMRERFDQLFGQLTPFAGGGDSAWTPSVDLEETDDAWIVEADVPGAKRNDITAEVHGQELRIHGEIKERQRVGVLRRRTRRTGEFDYRVTLPGEVDADNITADLDHGVLTVTLPKHQAAKPKRIEIGSGS